MDPKLVWMERCTDGSAPYYEAQLGKYADGDGVMFTLQFCPTNYRRGRYTLFITIATAKELCWGCFDEADQPTRYFHSLENAKSEAQEIANVLWEDRAKERGDNVTSENT